MDPSALDIFFIFLDIGDRKPRGLEPGLSLCWDASFAFFPFFPPNRPLNIPFFFFFSPLSGVGGGFNDDLAEDGVGASVCSCSSGDSAVLVSTLIACAAVVVGAVS